MFNHFNIILPVKPKAPILPVKPKAPKVLSLSDISLHILHVFLIHSQLARHPSLPIFLHMVSLVIFDDE
jgi:hypothetical protein